MANGFDKKQKAQCYVSKKKTSFGNFGVVCKVSNVLVDSAISLADAQEVCEHINLQLKTHPLYKPTPTKWREWCMRYQEWTPEAYTILPAEIKGKFHIGIGKFPQTGNRKPF